jgi:GNAT superfamily N-acetyltransferase
MQEINMNRINEASLAASAMPAVLCWTDKLLDGRMVNIRPLTQEDDSLELDLLQRCSAQTRRFRFLGSVQPTTKLAKQLTTLDADHDLAFVATLVEDGSEHAIGVSRYRTGEDCISGECAIMVRDDFQGCGLGVILMRHLIDVARSRGVKTLMSIDSAENHRMRELADFFGFERHTDAEDAAQVIHTLRL